MDEILYNDFEVIHNCLLEKRISLIGAISSAKNDNDEDKENIKRLEQEYGKITNVFMKVSKIVNNICELEKEIKREKDGCGYDEKYNNEDEVLAKVFHDI